MVLTTPSPADNATPGRGDSYLVPRFTFGASLTSICFASVAVSSASQPGVDWTGALTPGAVSVLCLILVIVLHGRARRAARSWAGRTSWGADLA